MEEIIAQHKQLDKELRMALATMERSDKVYDIKKKIIKNQTRCPHFSTEYSWAVVDNKCPYCGFILGGLK